MSIISQFFEPNKLVIYFVYPLIFFLMGFGILLKNTLHSRFYLAKSLQYLAIFGILHGVSDWGNMFIPLQNLSLNSTPVFVLESIRLILNSISFAFLFYFGLHLLVQTMNWNQKTLLIPPLILLIWFSHFIYLQPFLLTDHNREWWFAISDIWSRYLLCFPGAAISSYALFVQRIQFQAFGVSAMTRTLMFSALSVGVYALTGGIIVPYAPVLPAMLFNSDLFLSTTGMPIELFRGLSGLFMVFFILKILKVFDIEYRNYMYEAEMQKAVLQERTQIARDLHDGMIQSIYAAGLHLERIRNMLSYKNEEKIEQSQKELQGVVKTLNDIIKEIRGYIKKLKTSEGAQTNLKQEFEKIIEEMNVGQQLQLDWQYHNSGDEPPLPQTVHICFIVREALSNVLRHSGAKKVEISLDGNHQKLQIEISDNGVGFEDFNDPLNIDDGLSFKQGIKNMKFRAKVIDGNLTISSKKGMGTKISLILIRGGS